MGKIDYVVQTSPRSLANDLDPYHKWSIFPFPINHKVVELFTYRWLQSILEIASLHLRQRIKV